MMEHPPTLWLIVAIVFAIAEMILPSFGAIFGTVAALLLAVLTAVMNVAVAVQVIVFALLTIASMIYLRPIILKRMEKSKGVPSRTDALLGKAGIITTATDAVSGIGRALIEGGDWAVQSDQILEVNTKIEVVGSNGIILVVKKI